MNVSPIGSDLLPAGFQGSGGDSLTPFLQLVVQELQNQNPLEPVSNSEFLGQLAQFSTLEMMQSLNRTMSAQASITEFGQATALVGRRVAYLADNAGGIAEGRVDSVLVQGGQVLVEIDGTRVPLGNVIQVFADARSDAGDAASPPPAPGHALDDAGQIDSASD